MLETLIVADDLSGAADCAIACVATGAETLVMIEPTGDLGAAQVVAADADSRALAPHEAGRAVTRVIERLYSRDTRILYQKMDSTLRGNWVTEVAHIRAAAARVAGYTPLAIIAPAFPAAGRVTLRGHVLVDDVPLEATEIWKREGLKGTASLPALLEASGIRLEVATLEHVEQGADALSNRILAWQEAGCEAVICDARSDDDLLTIAKASFLLPQKPLWVGSAGLMRALIRGGNAGTLPVSSSVQAIAGKPVLTVVGSASGTSRAQFDVLAREAGATSVRIPPSALRPGAEPASILPYTQMLDNAFGSGKDIGVIIDGGETVALHEGPRLAAALANMLAPRISQIGGLVVTGGEMARAILSSVGIKGLRMRGEVETGVPLGLSIGSVSLPVVTKAGAFGDSMTLVRCRATLRAGGIDHSIPPQG